LNSFAGTNQAAGVQNYALAACGQGSVLNTSLEQERPGKGSAVNAERETVKNVLGQNGDFADLAKAPAAFQEKWKICRNS
jgi:hypothetical protein